jgi:hypothetical protein
VPFEFSEANDSSLFLKSSGLVNPVLLAPGLGEDPERVQVLQEDRVHGRKLELDGQVVDLARLADGRGVVGDLRRRLLAALDRVDDVVGGEGRAVVELDVRPKLDPPDERRHLLPLRGEARHDRELAIAARQPLVHLPVHHVGHGLVLRVRVHGLGIALAGPAQGLRVQRGGRERERGAHENGESGHGGTPWRRFEQNRSVGRKTRAAAAAVLSA